MKVLPKISLVALSLFASAAFAGQLTVSVMNNSDTALYPESMGVQSNLYWVSVPNKIPAHTSATMVFENKSTTSNAIVNGGPTFTDAHGSAISLYIYGRDANDFNSPVVVRNQVFRDDLTAILSSNEWDRQNNKTITETINNK